jgi:hypothetical protein
VSKAAHEYHLIDLVGISHGGFVSLAGARQFARQEGLSAWDIFHGNVRIEYHDPDDWERSEVKAKARPLDVSATPRTHALPPKLNRCRKSLSGNIKQDYKVFGA